MIQKLTRKGYTALTSADFNRIAAEAAAGQWNVRKAFHTCEHGYEAVDARGRIHGTDCCGSMAVLSHYKHEAAQGRKKGPLLLKAD